MSTSWTEIEVSPRACVASPAPSADCRRRGRKPMQRPGAPRLAGAQGADHAVTRAALIPLAPATEGMPPRPLPLAAGTRTRPEAHLPTTGPRAKKRAPGRGLEGLRHSCRSVGKLQGCHEPLVALEGRTPAEAGARRRVTEAFFRLVSQ